MPEIVSTHPEVVKQVLKSANVQCGTDKKAKILTSCPKDNLCILPKGELCIYGVKEVNQMTQISPLDLFQVQGVIIPMVALFLLIFLLGTLFGIKLIKK